MKTLYLIRHAKSSWGEPGLADFDRPLNKRGKRDIPQMGIRLKELGAVPDLIVSSPAKRAITTAREIADELGYERNRIVLNDRIYGATAEDTLRIVRSTDDEHASVMVFGHNPTMTDLVNVLTDIDLDNMPTCGAVCATFDVEAWGELGEGLGKSVFFKYPKLLG